MPGKFEPHTPTWRIYVADCSSGVRDDILQKAGGKVFETWLFSEESATYICSAEKMAELTFLGHVPLSSPDDDEAREELCEDIIALDCATRETDYVSHSRAVQFSLPAFDRPEARTFVNTLEEWEQDRQDALESIRGNTVNERVVDQLLSAGVFR